MSDRSPDLYGDIVKVVVPLAQMLIVAIGWKFVSRDNDKREARKEIRSILNEIKKVVLEVEQLAVRYYQMPVGKGREEETLLKRQLKQIGVLSTSATRLNHRVELSTPLADFRRAVTGDDFESATRTPVEQGDDRLEAIAAATTQFMDETERIFAEAYSR